MALQAELHPSLFPVKECRETRALPCTHTLYCVIIMSLSVSLHLSLSTAFPPLSNLCFFAQLISLYMSLFLSTSVPFSRLSPLLYLSSMINFVFPSTAGLSHSLSFLLLHCHSRYIPHTLTQSCLSVLFLCPFLCLSHFHLTCLSFSMSVYLSVCAVFTLTPVPCLSLSPVFPFSNQSFSLSAFSP